MIVKAAYAAQQPGLNHGLEHAGSRGQLRHYLSLPPLALRGSVKTFYVPRPERKKSLHYFCVPPLQVLTIRFESSAFSLVRKLLMQTTSAKCWSSHEGKSFLEALCINHSERQM